jgi:hypothetical protein
MTIRDRAVTFTAKQVGVVVAALAASATFGAIAGRTRADCHRCAGEAIRPSTNEPKGAPQPKLNHQTAEAIPAGGCFWPVGAELPSVPAPVVLTRPAAA